MASIKAGFARVDITPEVSLPLRGNFRGEDYAARGVHDPLTASAMVLANSRNQKVALLTIDICNLVRENVAFMREIITAACDIRADQILMAAIHTHSGPGTSESKGFPTAPASQVAALFRKAAQAVILADKNLTDSRIRIGSSRENRISFNRRLKCKDGQTHMNWERLDPEFVIEPAGPIDPEVKVLSIEQQNRPRAALVNFALHPAILAGDNWLYSADYPGYLAEAMTRLHDPDFTTLFFNGCCGNINHIDYADPIQGRGYQMTQRVGYLLAVAAHEAMKQSLSVEGTELRASLEKVPLPRMKISAQQHDWARQVLEKAKTNPAPRQVDGLPDEYYAHLWLDMYQQQNHDDAVEVMAIRVGNVGIVGIPGEMFCELSMHIRESSPADHTVVIELAGDSIGYLPNRQAFSVGGYEVTPGSTFYACGAGETLLDSALRQLHTLFD